MNQPARLDIRALDCGRSSQNVLEDRVDHPLGEERVAAVKHQGIDGREGGQGDCCRA
jgi:hypothetical protein